VLGLVVTNLARHKARTIHRDRLALGVATIVALLSVGAGPKADAPRPARASAPTWPVQSGVQDPTASCCRRRCAAPETPPDSRRRRLLLVVRRAPGSGGDRLRRRPQGLHRPAPVVGSSPSPARSDPVGDPLARTPWPDRQGRAFTVAGIYHSGVFFEDSGARLDLAVAQRIERRGADARPSSSRATPTTPPPRRRSARGARHAGHHEPTRATRRSQRRAEAQDRRHQAALADRRRLVTNTMAMAVLERQRELEKAAQRRRIVGV
jgi:hypothetical protein